jgi:glycosyltransferase involved in cell wall biosynthesis
VAVFALNWNFTADILRHLEKHHEVRRFERGSDDDMLALMRWSDVSWFEWCTLLAEQASRLPKVTRTVCRLHRFEAFERFPGTVDWSKFDALILVSPLIRRLLQARVPRFEERVRVHMVPNGVDLDRFRLHRRPEGGRHIAWVGSMHHKKGSQLLVQAMRHLSKTVPGVRFSLAGPFQDPVSKLYYRSMVRDMELEEVVRHDGVRTDLPEWLADKDMILTTSMIEGCPVALAEGMAAGLKPLVHAWPGWEAFYPRQWVYYDLPELERLVLEAGESPETYRGFVERHFDLSRQLGAFDEIFFGGDAQEEAATAGMAAAAVSRIRTAAGRRAG